MSVAPNATTPTKAAVPSGKIQLFSIGRMLLIIVAVAALVGVFAYLKDRPLEARTAKSAESPTVPGGKAEQQPPPPVKLLPGEIASKYADAVVVLDNYNEQGQSASQGSGFVSSSDGIVLTNYHVIRGASRMAVRTHDQSIHEVEYVAGFDMQHDIAALKISGDGLSSVPLGSSSIVKTGDHVTALGAPLGLESTLSDGIISAVRETRSFRVFQTSAPISRGSSGGPLFDDYGNVIAMAVATIEAGENLNFAVPIDSAKVLLKSERQTSFAELLSETAMHQPILASSISLPPQVTALDIAVPPQGGILVGSFSIAGGLGNDLGVSLAADNGGLVWNGGIIKNFGNLNLRLRGGRYKLVLNNKMGAFWISPKTVSGTIELSYYR
jgi:hypothetical protein